MNGQRCQLTSPTTLTASSIVFGCCTDDDAIVYQRAVSGGNNCINCSKLGFTEGNSCTSAKRVEHCEPKQHTLVMIETKYQ